MTDLAHAKLVCEACFLGIEVEGMKASVNPSVQGVGIGNKVVHGIARKQRALQVYVHRKQRPTLLRPELKIPDEVEGVPTDVVESGMFQIGRKYPPIYQRRVRPAMPGVSIGHHRVSAGTFGALVRRGRETYILSNNHVLANEGEATVGDPVLQPGRYDGGRPDRDAIAQLADFTTLEREKTNLVDAAIASPIVREEVAPEVLNIGRVAEDGGPDVDLPVRKSGRTTRYTEGVVTATDVTLRVAYSRGFLVFTDQFLIKSGKGAFSGPGDSGALVVDAERRGVGLLFAGSPFFSVANRWKNVREALRVQLAG